ncbi:MAG: hypothetical protein ACRD38_06170 [Nitrososphaerales archaeon]
MQSVTSIKTGKNNHVDSANLRETVRLQLRLRSTLSELRDSNSDSEVS